MILTTSIDKGFIFLSIVAVITSVIGAVYYLWIIKIIVFDTNKNSIDNYYVKKISENLNLENINLKISSILPYTISILTLLILLYMFFEIDIITLINIYIY